MTVWGDDNDGATNQWCMIIVNFFQGPIIAINNFEVIKNTKKPLQRGKDHQMCEDLVEFLTKMGFGQYMKKHQQEANKEDQDRTNSKKQTLHKENYI